MEEVRNKSTKQELETTPAALSTNDYILFSHFVELFEPLCVLTDAVQGDKILGPSLIPKLLETYIRKFTFWNTFLYFYKN